MARIFFCLFAESFDFPDHAFISLRHFRLRRGCLRFIPASRQAKRKRVKEQSVIVHS